MLKFFTMVVFICCARAFTEDVTVDINRYGRPVQVDGFLMEWSIRTARAWSKAADTDWYWDAVNTSEGLSGYFRSERRSSCSDWIFTIDPHGIARPLTMHVPADTQGSMYFKSDRGLYDSAGIIVLEWVIPWDSVGLDTSGNYAISIFGNSACGDTLPSLLLTGTKEKRTITPRAGAIVRYLLAIVVIVVYIIVTIRIRSRTPRKESPHQST